MRKKKKRVFSKELTLLIMLIYMGAMLILGSTFSVISVTLFSQKAKEDMLFYLENMGKQFEAKVQFIEDSIITIRHNIMLNDFFNGENYKPQEITTQLAYSSNLFSERNIVNSHYPFIERIYIFNKKGEYESDFFYPTTVSERNELDLEYSKLYQSFSEKDLEYDYRINKGVLDVCLYLYDINMNKMGTCIVGVNVQSIEYIFQDLEKYKACTWQVSGGGEENLVLLEFSNGRTNQLEENTSWLKSASKHGFGLGTFVQVKKNEVYSSLFPTLITFIVVFFSLLFGISGIVIFLSRRFSRPLKIIVEHIRDFGRSGLNTRLEGFSTQEFDDISIVFNEMADRINDLIVQNYEKKLFASQAQVRFLQSQINPHFMFNIMSMIGMRAKLQGNDDVMDLLTAFSKLIQGKIFRKDEIKIPLREEMELVGFYLYLQSNRFRDKITYEIKYADESVKENLIPRLCIEPIVENAVSHGLEQKEGKGKISIYIYEKEEGLYIVVSDDGVGFDVQEMLESHRDSDENHVHIGLTNTMELIHILYGEGYGVKIDSKKNVGTKVIIELPVEKGMGRNVESDYS